MAQIIKHRRGSITQLKDVTARISELVVATGSIGDLNGPFLFVGETEGVAGAYRPISKIYQGATAPTITVGSHGSVIDGTPFYASGNKSLYTLSKDGNNRLDLTGNIEGNIIDSVTINNLTGTTATFDTVNLGTVAFTGLTEGRLILGGPNGSLIDSGSLNFNNTELGISGSIKLNSDAYIYNDGALYVEDHNNGVQVQSNNFVDLQSNNNYVYLESGYNEIHSDGNTDIYSNGTIQVQAASGNLDMWADDGTVYLQNNTNSGSIEINARNGGTTYINTAGGNGVGEVRIGSGDNNLYGNTSLTELWASQYSQLASGNEYVWAENGQGAFLQAADGDYGLSVRSTGQIEVTGSFYVGNDLSFDGTKLQIGGGKFEVDTATGDLRTTGSITMKGNITIGDNQGGDVVNLGAEISSSLIPSGSNIFDIGSPTNYWHNLYVSGTANVGVLNASSISLSGITVFNDLLVSGSSYLGSGGAGNVYITGSVYNDQLTDTYVLFAGPDGQITDNPTFTFNSTTGYLEAPIIRASNDGNGTNFLVGNDMWIGDINQANQMIIKGQEDENYARILLNASTNQNYLDASYGDVTLSANNNLNLQSQNNSVYLESYDGSIYLNSDSGNNIQLDGNTFLNTNRTMYVSRMRDNSDNSNMLELYGAGTDDGYWWESGNGSDTTLYNWMNGSNTNILQMNSGNVNIAAHQGSVNLSSDNGFNVTGSMIVSDGSGVFNSSLITNNSNLTLTSGSNLSVENGGTATVDGNANFHNNVYISGHTYSDNYHGITTYDNALHLNGGSLGAQQVELTSTGQISLYSEGGGSDYAINLTGSVYSADDITINNNNTLRTRNISGVNGGDLTIATDADINIYSDSNRFIQLYTNNAENGTNYLWVQNDGVGFQTYDSTSELNHTVYLDNTGSLMLNNVNVMISGSLGVDGNTTYNNDLVVGGNMYVSGNFTVLGTGSIVTLSGSQVDIGTNKIILNTYAPFERFAGIDVYDSGSNAGVTGSLLWDSQENVWVYANPSGSAYASARLISGPQNSGSLGGETGLTTGHFPIAQSDDHIMDSLLTYLGTTLALNTNKFTVDSDSGDTVIAGNFTIHGNGGTDNGGATSYVVFKNSDDVLGYVDTNDTHNELDHLLGYNTNTGLLEFSSLIDGGTY